MEINKDLLNSALSSIRRYANDLKAFRHAEEVIETFLAAQASIGDLTAKVAALKVEAETLSAQRDADEAAHRVRLAEMDVEIAEKKAELDKELAGIKAVVVDAKASSEQKVAAFRASVKDAEALSEQAKVSHANLLSILNTEIAAKQGVLDNLNAEIAAIRARLG